MYIYIITYIILLILYILSKINKKNSTLYFIIGILLLFFLAAFRGENVGADTSNYLSVYEQIDQTNLTHIFDTQYLDSSHTYYLSLELGYILLNKICSLLSIIKSNQNILIFMNSLYYILLYKLLKRESPNPNLSLLFFMGLGFFQTTLNLSRNAVAILLCLLAISYYKKGKKANFYILTLIGCFIHLSSIFFLAFPIINEIKFNKRKIIIFVFIAFAIMNINFIWNTILLIVPTRYRIYMLSSKKIDEAIMVFIFQLIIYLILMVFLKLTRKHKFSVDNFVGNKLFILTTVMYFFSIKIEHFTRVAALTMPYNMIYFTQLIEFVQNKKNEKLIVSIIIILLTIQYVLRLNINNIGSTMPYYFFWNQ